ncbi:hypothetical protein JCM10914A_11650 [Paenibacillus sp. JCM 10914]|uniref:YwmB family TATA-box binding protein n=1 Tax=Paenibacillus sp. JCM 10914 TaxID=1236974 RepID=UPI0003CCB252|nr:YwmB family TATA-box binding protein [Paenibacillus sp. JCM 10914]GAE08087.1 hypothetical protein JCM10914_4348 [Paenibacillus sp. JCM 10914]
MRGLRLQVIMMVLVLCASVGIILGFKGITGEQYASITPERAVATQTDAAAIGNELKLLIDFGNELMVPKSVLTLKIQGELINTLSIEQANTAAQELGNMIGLHNIVTSTLQGNKVFTAGGMLSGVDVKLDWALTQQGKSHVRILLVSQSPQVQQQELVSLLDGLQQSMLQAGIEPNWNVSIQGYASENVAAKETIEQAENVIIKTLPISLVEHYDDSTTVSRSYYAARLSNFVRSGNDSIHMQMAVHEDSVKKSSRITIGFPVITVEY